MNKLWSFLELVRLPNLFTAMADIMAAGWIVSGLNGNPFSIELFYLMLSSTMLYGFGMVFNDYFDYDIDKKERPERPLPSGRISKQEALLFGIALLVIAFVFAALTSKTSLIIAIVLSITILLYDRFTKHNFFVGPLTMGLCRLLNLILGFTLVSGQLSQYWWISIISLIYIFTVTFLARAEVGDGTYFGRILVMALVVIFCSLAALLIGDMNHFYMSIIAVIIFLIWTFRGILPALKNPTSMYIRKAVGVCIVGLPLLVAVLATNNGGFVAYVSVSVFMLISFIFSRLFAVT